MRNRSDDTLERFINVLTFILVVALLVAGFYLIVMPDEVHTAPPAPPTPLHLRIVPNGSR